MTMPTAYTVTMLSWGLAQFSSGYNSAGQTTNALEQIQVRQDRPPCCDSAAAL